MYLARKTIPPATHYIHTQNYPDFVLLKRVVDFDTHGTNQCMGFVIACRMGEIKTVQKMIELEINVTYNDFQAYKECIENKRDDILELLRNVHPWSG